MSANADPNPYATLAAVRDVISTLRVAAAEMERQHPDDLIVTAQNKGALLVIDIIEATLNNSLEDLVADRGVPTDVAKED